MHKADIGSIRRCQWMFTCSVAQDDLFFEADQWQVIPTKDGLIGEDPHGVIDIKFTVSVPGLDCVQKFETTFQHGAPAQLKVNIQQYNMSYTIVRACSLLTRIFCAINEQVLSPEAGFSVENGDTLQDIVLGCFDDSGNRAAHITKARKVVLDADDGVS